MKRKRVGKLRKGPVATEEVRKYKTASRGGRSQERC